MFFCQTFNFKGVNLSIPQLKKIFFTNEEPQTRLKALILLQGISVDGFHYVMKYLKAINSQAKKLGFSDYLDFFSQGNEISVDQIKKAQDDIDSRTSDFIPRIYSHLEEAGCTSPLLGRVPQKFFLGEDKLSSSYTMHSALKILFNFFETGNLKNYRNILFSYQGAGNSFTFPVSIPFDIRVFVNKHMTSLFDWPILFHEAGHAVHFAHIKPGQVSLLRDFDPFNEAMAEMTAMLLYNPSWRNKFCRFSGYENELLDKLYMHTIFLRRLESAYMDFLVAFFTGTEELFYEDYQSKLEKWLGKEFFDYPWFVENSLIYFPAITISHLLGFWIYNKIESSIKGRSITWCDIDTWNSVKRILYYPGNRISWIRKIENFCQGDKI